MDLRELAREQRRRQVLDALEFEREREVALRGALEQAAGDLEGATIDDSVFARMAPEEVDVVRGTLAAGGELDLSEELGEEWFSGESDEEVREERVAEAARLEAELAESRRRQAAFERYLELL